MKITIEKAKELILKKAEEIRGTVDRSSFCEPNCEACLRAEAKSLVDKDLRINIPGSELIEDAFIMAGGGKPKNRCVTDFALEQLAC